jgi:hypothetical protein
MNSKNTNNSDLLKKKRFSLCHYVEYHHHPEVRNRNKFIKITRIIKNFNVMKQIICHPKKKWNTQQMLGEV